MAQLIFHVENQYIHRLDEFHVVARSNHYLYAEFTFSDDWVGVKTALFSIEADDGETITKPMLIGADGTCEVPHEVLEYDNSQLEVSAFCGNRVTANVAVVPVHESGYNNDSAPDDPTPDVYTQIINRLANVEQIVIDKATESESWAVGGTDTRDGEDTDNSKYYSEQASQSATNAAQSATSASESATSASGSASAASVSAGIASEKATEATTAKASIDIAVEEIRGIETNVRTYSQNAAHSAEEASETISVVRGYSETASQSARSASSSALDASASATSASGSASRASGYATNAQNYATASERSMQGASASERSAAQSATNAANYSTNAENSATSASDARDAAEAAQSAIQSRLSQITTNTQNIAQNTEDIAQNTSDIADVKEDLNELTTATPSAIGKVLSPKTVTNGKVTEWQFKTIEGGGGGGSPMEETTWAELKAKRDGGQLTPGMQYRITDYVCTTTQEETRAVSHPFDIIVVADDENTLNENARACLHEGDNYYSSEGHQADLEAWELKYRIDNDTSNFLWVDAMNGKGVIYYMKDDRDNECSYDFKQIQFKRYKITECEAAPLLVGKYTALEHGEAITAVDDENPVWCYTFSVYDQDSETVEMFDGSIYPMSEEGAFVFGNSLPAYEAFLGGNVFVFVLGGVCNSNTFGNNCGANTFGNNCNSNTLGSGCVCNTFGDDCGYNTFGDNCVYNTFVDGCYSNTFGNSCESNTFGNSCYYNTFGDDCGSNTFGNNCNSNTFGNNCGANTFGNNCVSNTFGNSCGSNTFGDNCVYNTFGDSCESNTFGNSCYSNTFGNRCYYVDFAVGSHMANVQYYHILDGVQGANSSHVTIPATEGNNHVTYIGKNSQGVLKTWVPADLAP